MEAILENQGYVGWELVSVVPFSRDINFYVAFFKKEIIEQE